MGDTGTAGTVVVEATQAGDAAYFAAPSVTQSFNVTIPQQPQTITFDAIPNKLTTSTPFALSATASSGLAVSFSVVSGPATVVGNQVTLTGTAGTVVVEATQAGDAAYFAAPSVTQAFNVTIPQQPQTITFAAIPNKLTTSTPFALSASASSGLAVSFSIVSGPATVVGNQVTLTGTVGTVVIEVTQAGDAAYFAAPSVTQSFNVTAPVLTYCTNNATSAAAEWISRIKLGSLIKNSGASTTGYSNYTSSSVTLTKGVANTLAFRAAFAATTYVEYIRIYIDYNQNGVFEVAERAYQGKTALPASGTLLVNKNIVFTVPTTALSGSTRMRVSMRRGAYPSVCGAYAFGEVEDYTVVIAGAFNNINGIDGTETTQLETSKDADLQLFMNRDVSIYPNPATNQITLGIEQFFGLPLYITATDATGRVYYNRTLSFVDKTTIDTDVTTWPIGVYIFRFVSESGEPVCKQVIVAK